MLTKKNSHTELSIELARIIACIMVISIHANLPFVNDEGGVITGRLFFSCIIGDAVAIFWMIAGAFAFGEGKDYYCQLNKSFKKIGIPMIVSSILIFWVSILFERKEFADALKNPLAVCLRMIKSIMVWGTDIPNCPHFWYMYAYLILALIYPLLNEFIVFIDRQNVSYIKGYVFIIFIIYFFNDVTLNKLLGFSNHSVSAVIPAAFEMLIGHLFWKNKEVFEGKIMGLGALLIFLFINVARCVIQLGVHRCGIDSNHILYWYTSFGLICSFCILVICINVDKYIISRELISNMVLFIGSSTFVIYLFHILIYDFLVKRMIVDNIKRILLDNHVSRIWDYLYMLLISGLVFLLGLLVAVLMKAVKAWWCRTCKDVL